MRAHGLFLVLIACRPSATIENTMPVANLQSYRTASVRVHTNAFAAQGNAAMLESAVLVKLQEKCGFERVDGAGAPADVILDLNIIRLGRGGGMISNENLATMETLMVLSDSDGPIGTAKIKGESSGMVINNAPPENEAIEVTAKTIAELLAKSGCAGPRVARAEPPPPPPPADGSAAGSGSAAVVATGSGSTGEGSAAVPPPAPNEARRKEADALNEQGKVKLYAADSMGAAALFQQANSLVPDPRYAFNLCIALGAAEAWDKAIAACKDARNMNPSAALAAKIDTKLERLQQKQ